MNWILHATAGMVMPSEDENQDDVEKTMIAAIERVLPFRLGLPAWLATMIRMRAVRSPMHVDGLSDDLRRDIGLATDPAQALPFDGPYTRSGRLADLMRPGSV